MDVGCSVTDALRRSAKGRLSYETDWRYLSAPERQRYLEEQSAPEPLSSEICSFIDDQLSRRLQTSPSVQQSSPSSPRRHGSAVSLETEFEAPDGGLEGEAEELDRSVLEEVEEELNACSLSLDDQMMQEQAQEALLRHRYITTVMEDIRLRSEESFQLSLRESQRRREEEEEAWRAGELRRREESEELMRALAEESRRQEERAAAVVRSGEEEKQELIKKQEQDRLAEQCRHMEQIVGETADRLTSLYHALAQASSQTTSRLYTQAMAEVQSLASALKTLAINPNIIQMKEASVRVLGLKRLCDGLLEAVETDSQTARLQVQRETEQLAADALQRSQVEAKRNEELLLKAAEKLKKEQVQQEASDTTGGMPASAVAEYARVDAVLAKTTAACSEFTSSQDASLKKYRFALQKAIGTQINAISDQSGQHLLNKINKLRQLLSGRPLEVGGKSVSINDHPQARDYCSSLIAKKLVRQGEDQVASQLNTAFPVAAVAMGIWDEYPLVGDLILAQFYSTCPVLVPFCPPKKDSMTEAEHLKMQGYRVMPDGCVESSDLFLKRMSGLVRLYAAIVQSEPPNPTHKNPHGLQHGWVWFARVLNSAPHPTLTASALHDFLEVAGHALMKHYGKQFKKLLRLLCEDCVPRIKQLTPTAQRGPLARLTLFLEECISSGRIAQPKGCLSTNFWRTRSQGIQLA